MSFEFIQTALSALRTAIKNVVKRAYVTSVTDDSSDYPLVQITYASPAKTATAERISPYGLYVNFPKDSQVVVFTMQANEENRACMAYSQVDRFKNLKEGEVLVGNPSTQCFIKFDKDGNIEINSTKDINITSANDINVKATNVTVDADQVDLGVGGGPIARLGDTVKVGTDEGIITSAGVNRSI